MPAPFNLVAQLQIQGPNNLNQVVRRIQSSLNSVSANVNIALGRNTITNLTNANTQLTAMSTNLARVTADATAAAAAIQRMVSALGAAKTNTTNININNNLKQISNAAKTASGDMEEFGRVSALAVRRFVAFSIPAGFLVGAVTGFRSLVDAAIDYDKQMNRLEQVTMASKSTIADLSGEITRLSTSMGVSSKTLSEVSVVLASAGYTAKEVKTALETLAQTQLASQFDDIKTSTDGAIAVMQQFKMSASDLGKVFGEITNVSRGFAVESRDIVAGIQHAGGAFRAAGGNLEEFMALFTSVRATTRESAESIATGLRTIFTRIERPRTIEFLRQLGVELQDVNGMFVGPYEAIRRLSEAMKGLDTRDVRYSAVVEELGGYRQVSKVIPLLQEFATAQKALGVAQAGSNALSQEAAISQEALATKLAKVKEEWLKLGREFVESKGFKILADSAMSFATALTQVLRALQPVLPLLATLGSVMAVKAIGSAGAGFMKGLHFARGGMVPGEGNTDSVPAVLMPGEFVMRKQAVKSIGKDALESMNQYAAGGPVVSGRNAYGDMPDSSKAAMRKLGSIVTMYGEKPTANVAENFNIGEVHHSMRPAVDNTLHLFTQGVNEGAQHVKQAIGLKRPLKPFVMEEGSAGSLRGVVFEDILSVLGAKFTGGDRGSIDFGGGLGRILSRKLGLDPEVFGTTKSRVEAKYLMHNVRLKDVDKKFMSEGGTTGTDSIQAMLTPGEFVINREAVRRIGVENLKKANNVQKFAAGGPVGIGIGSAGSIVSTGLASGMIQSFFGAESAITKFTQTLTELIFTVEGTRAAMGLLQSVIGVQTKPLGGVGFMRQGDMQKINYTTSREYFDKMMELSQHTGGPGGSAQMSRYARVAAASQRGARIRMGASIGAVAGTALLAGGAEFLSSRYDAAADAQEGKFANGDFSGAAAYTSNKQTSNTLSNIGSFAATGAGIGAMFGPVGLAVGGVVGGLIGWGKSLYEADSITKDAAKKINDAKFGYYERTGREAAGRVLTGKSMNEMGDIATTNEAIKEQLNAIRADTDAKGKAEKTASLSNQMGTYDEFKNRMLKTANNLGEFKTSNGGLGQTLIDAMAKTQNIGAVLIEQSIKKEIDARHASEAALKKAAMLTEDFTETIRSMQHFTILLEGMNEKLDIANQSMSAFSAIAGGQYATVNPVASTTIAHAGNEAASVNKDELHAALGNLFGGAGEYGTQMINQTEQINQIMRELPGMLRRSLTSGYDIQTGLGKQFNELDKTGALGNSQFAQMIMSQLGASLGAGGASGTGEVDLARNIRQDAGKVAKQLEGAFGQDWNKAIADIERNLLEGARRITEAHKIYAQSQLQSTELEVHAAQTAATHQLETQRMNLMGTGLLPGLGELQAPFLAGISAQTRQTRAGGSTDVGVIASALDKVNSELAKPEMMTARENLSQGIKGPGEQRYSALFVESNRLTEALKKLANSSDLAAAAHDKFVEAFQQKETKGKFLEGYVFGDADTKLRTMYGMKGAQILSQRPDLERVMPEIMKDSARGFFQQFGNMHLPMFQINGRGTNAEGKPITGQMMLDEIKAAHFDKFLMSDKDRADMNMPNARTFGDVVRQQASVGTLDINQQKYLDEYKAANDIQSKAQAALLDQHRKAEAEIFQKLIDAMRDYTQSQKNSFDDLRLGAAEKQRDSLSGRALDINAQMTRATALNKQVNNMGINFGLTPGSYASINRTSLFGNAVAAPAMQDALLQARMFQNTDLGDFAGNQLQTAVWQAAHPTTGHWQNTGRGRRFIHDTRNVDEVSKIVHAQLPALTSILDMTGGGQEALNNLIGQSYSSRTSDKSRTDATAAVMKLLRDEAAKRQTAVAGGLGITEAQLQGFNTDANVKAVVAGQKGIEPGFDIDKARTELDRLNQQIATLASNLKNVDTARLDAFIASLSKILGQTAVVNIPIIDPRKPVAKADGGMMWKPQGTDTVPAMLTPGEFVVRREMAQKHKGLLHSINSDTLYAADGAEVPDIHLVAGRKLPFERAALHDKAVAAHQQNMQGARILADIRMPIPSDEPDLHPKHGPGPATLAYNAKKAAQRNVQLARRAAFENARHARAAAFYQRTHHGETLQHHNEQLAHARAVRIEAAKYAQHGPALRGAAARAFFAQQSEQQHAITMAHLKAGHARALAQQAATAAKVKAMKERMGIKDTPVVPPPPAPGANVFAPQAATPAAADKGDWFWNLMAENNKRMDATAAMHAQLRKQDMGERQKVADFHLQEIKSRGARRTHPLASDAAGLHSVKELREIARLERRHDMQNFAKGGAVDTVPAYLSKGEFVMSSAATARMGVDNLARMNKGGFVGHYAEGGNVTQNGNAMGGKAVQANLDVGPLKGIFDMATASFKTSSEGILQASTVFKTAFDSLTQTVAKIPANIEVKVNNISELATQTANFSSSLTDFNTGLKATASSFNGIVTNLQSVAQTLGGLVGSLKDKLTVDISVTHDVNVKVSGSVMSASDTGAIAQIAKDAVGPMLDQLKNRLSSFGPGLA